MKFDVEGKATVVEPKVGQVSRALRALKCNGSSSYASLTDDYGRYVQVAGGGITCMVEKYDPQSGERLRAFHDKPNPVYPDGTILSFRAGNLSMKSDEWFKSDHVVEIFTAFLNDSEIPSYVSWRPAPDL